MSLTPGSTAILETFSPAVRGRAAALGLHAGQVVRCVAAGSADVRLQYGVSEELTIAEDLARGILARLVEEPLAARRTVTATDREVRIPLDDERVR